MNTRLLARVLLRIAARREWKSIHKAADDTQQAYVDLMLKAFRAGRRVIKGSHLERALEHHDETGILIIVSDAIMASEKVLKDAFPELLLKTLEAGGNAAAKNLRIKVAMRAAAPAIKDFKFDVTNQKAVDWASKHAAETITGISNSTRDEIRELVETSFEDQIDVRELADQIADVIGDVARADTIARTESMRAANQGQSELWDQAVDQGLLTGDEQQEWIVTPDDKLCPICEPMDGVTTGLDDTFDVDGDEIDGPPAHPNCRCTVGLTL
jgi:SPP1 gp7 family putative phage head morphogenesis protein